MRSTWIKKVLKNKNVSVTTASRRPLFFFGNNFHLTLSHPASTSQQTKIGLANNHKYFDNWTMSATVRSILDGGNKAIVIDVECHMSNGLPAMLIVGFASKAVDESKERIRSAFASEKLDFPKKRITINLAPADIQKDSTSFDLPIAVAIMCASGQVANKIPKDTAFIGELGLDGKVRGVRGVR